MEFECSKCGHTAKKEGKCPTCKIGLKKICSGCNESKCKCKSGSAHRCGCGH